jgi:hypothetical protein
MNVTDGAGDRYEIAAYGATFTLKPLDHTGDPIVVDSQTLRQLGIEWNGCTLTKGKP